MKNRSYFEFSTEGGGTLVIMHDQITALEYDWRKGEIRIWAGNKGWKIQFESGGLDIPNEDTGEIELITVEDIFKGIKDSVIKGENYIYEDFEFSPIL